MRDRMRRASKKIRGRRRAPERAPDRGAAAPAAQFASPACLMHEFALETREARAKTPGDARVLRRRAGRSVKRMP